MAGITGDFFDDVNFLKLVLKESNCQSILGVEYSYFEKLYVVMNDFIDLKASYAEGEVVLNIPSEYGVSDYPIPDFKILDSNHVATLVKFYSANSTVKAAYFGLSELIKKYCSQASISSEFDTINFLKINNSVNLFISKIITSCLTKEYSLSMQDRNMVFCSLLSSANTLLPVNEADVELESSTMGRIINFYIRNSPSEESLVPGLFAKGNYWEDVFKKDRILSKEGEVN